MGNCNVEKACQNEVQYVCGCLDSETFCCEIHLKEHLKALDRNHSFDSISTGLCEWTKDGFLEFLENEKLEKEKAMTIILDFFAQNSDIPINTIEKYLNKLDSNWKDISDNIENISQVSEKEEGLLANLLNLQPESDAESAENNFSNILDSNFKLFYRLGKLKNKRQAILSKAKNDPEIEQDFRRTCALYQNYPSNFLLSQAYKEYINNYQRLASLYLIFRSEDEIKLFIYDTENQREEVKIFKCDCYSNEGFFVEFSRFKTYLIIQLPNNEYFIFGLYSLDSEDNDHDYQVTCIVYIIDRRCWYLPRDGKSPEKIYTAIYFNKSIYCFGSYYVSHNGYVDVFTRFDLDGDRWIELAPIGRDQRNVFSSVIFKGNILLSEYDCNLFLYSIDINSFSKIPYKFAKDTKKILISIAEKLYLIECGKNRWIYESGDWDEYNWQKISISKIYDNPSQFYISYNKGEIYISLLFHGCFREYFKFDLRQKTLIEIACYDDNLVFESLDSKLTAIKCNGQTFKLDSSYNQIGNYPFYIALGLPKLND